MYEKCKAGCIRSIKRVDILISYLAVLSKVQSIYYENDQRGLMGLRKKILNTLLSIDIFFSKLIN